MLPSLPEAPPRPADPPAGAPALTGLALVRRLAAEGHWQEAASGCETLLAQDQLNPSIHFYQALIQEQMRQHAEAERALRRAIYLDRGFVLAHYHLALLLRKNGHRDPAIQSLRNVRALLARMPDDAPIAEADGLTANDLNELTDLHLELLQK